MTMRDCPVCGGRGRHTDRFDITPGPLCRTCKGSGVVSECQQCNATGLVYYDGHPFYDGQPFGSLCKLCNGRGYKDPSK